MRRFILAAVLGIAGLGFAGSKADAHEPGFGVGPHDLAPHWHRTNTLFGPVYWYGNGVHDVLPHAHGYSPWTGINSYSLSPFGPTRSFNGYPYYGGYNRGYYGGGYGGYYGGHHHRR